MTATNHAVTGAVIGLTVVNPWLAVPAAVASHLVCDAIPHYGGSVSLNSKKFKVYLIIDASLCIALVGFLFLYAGPAWLLAAVCAFAATSPDLIWIRKFRVTNEGKSFRPSLVEKFLGKIQWFERPSGALVEAVWLVAGLAALSVLT